MGVSPSGLGALLDEFEENFVGRGELGASVSVWWRGEEMLSEGRGWCEKEHRRPWTPATLVPVYSATKAPSTAALLLALDDQGMTAETAVGEVWPGFPVPEASFAELLSHQCGLAALDRVASLWDHEEVVAAIEAQKPAWRPGEGHGYHPRTFGALVEEPMRRLTGGSLGAFWNDRFARPLDLDFWIGLPESANPRVARLYPGKASPGDFVEGFYKEFNREGSVTQRAFGSPRGLRSVQEMNDPKAWHAGFPAMGGVGTASALAKFYQMVLGNLPGPLSPEIRAAMMNRRIDGQDKVLVKPTSFAVGCQLDPLDASGVKLRSLFGPSPEGFGHPGAGGSHAFGDPDSGISFGYVMNQMELSVMPGRRSTVLVDALYG